MPNLPVPHGDPPGRGQVRASDADRDLAIETLRQAAVDGRITLDELDQRLDAVSAAKTYAELGKVTEDLPAAALPAPAVGSLPVHRFGGTPTSRLGIALMSGFNRAGRWVVPHWFPAVAIMGGGCIDMRNASFAGQTTRITVLALMGGIDIVVPVDAEVRAHGLGLLGGFGGHRAAGPGHAGAPVIIVTGLAIMGGISIRRRPPKSSAR